MERLKNDNKRKHANMDDFEAVEEAVLSAGGNYFSNTIRSAPEAARKILAALSHPSEHPNTQTPKHSSHRWLAHRCLITDHGQLGIPVLGRWIREEEAVFRFFSPQRR